MKQTSFYTGTAGWSYKDWVPVFYPKQQSGNFDWLQFYAKYFNCVEVNATYYTYLSPNVAKAWVRKTDDCDDFRFTIKLHQDFTHKRNFNKDSIAGMKNILDILAENNRLGGLLIQFPYSFYFNSGSADYVRKLNGLFDEYNRFLEIRSAGWHNEHAFRLLRDLDITLCTVDQPQIGKAVPFDPIITNDKAYIRFHGRNTEAWKQSIANYGRKQSYAQQSERYKYLYSVSELTEITETVKKAVENAKEAYVIMNNHPAGYAVANALEMRHLLEDIEKLDMPETIVKHFGRLERLAGVS